MDALVLACGKVFDGISDTLTGPAEILVRDNRIAQIERSVERPPGARVIDLSERAGERTRRGPGHDGALSARGAVRGSTGSRPTAAPGRGDSPAPQERPSRETGRRRRQRRPVPLFSAGLRRQR